MPYPINPTDVPNKLPHFPTTPWTQISNAITDNALAGLLGKKSTLKGLTTDQYATLLPVLGAMLAAGALNAGKQKSGFSVQPTADQGFGLNLNYTKNF